MGFAHLRVHKTRGRSVGADCGLQLDRMTSNATTSKDAVWFLNSISTLSPVSCLVLIVETSQQCHRFPTQDVIRL
jgi:hypothetical protein